MALIKMMRLPMCVINFEKKKNSKEVSFAPEIDFISRQGDH